VAKTFRFRFARILAATVVSFAALGASAPAALDMTVGPHLVVPNEPVSACSSKAKSALDSVLQNAFEAGAGTGQWLAYGPLDSSGKSSATAAIHCYPLDNGYVVTFTCAAQVPPNADSAVGLCQKLSAAFGAAKTAALAAPGAKGATR
jgi:hypothetical protein